MHIHVPDGVFPIWIWLGSILILLPLLALAVLFVRKDRKRLVITSAVTALLLIVFSMEVFGFHLNFTTLSGILLGPWWSLISLTVVNIFLALFGHGGITVAPINILINWAEALAGFAIFRLFFSRLRNQTLKSAMSGFTVILALMFSFTLFLGVISLTGINPGLALEQGAVNASENVTSIAPGAEYVPLAEFAAISLIPTIIGGFAEAILTGLVVRFILKTKPSLIA
jgi:ABC-type Co2+ transport system permease subunit